MLSKKNSYAPTLLHMHVSFQKNFQVVHHSIDFSMSNFKHEFHSILAFILTISNNVAATKITRRNTMHKNTRSILGNPSQQGKTTQPDPLLYYLR
jgi:hypothetical protein